MKNISTVTGIVEDANFPMGYKIVDGQTYVNADLYQDMVQTFQKMVQETMTIPNGEFDNNVNGYQMLEAMRKYIDEQVVVSRVGAIGKEIIPFFGWNMNTTVEYFINFPTGFESKISDGVLSINAMIKSTLGYWFKIESSYNPATGGSLSQPGGFIYLNNVTNRIEMVRGIGSCFETDASFNNASGFIVVEYVDLILG